MNSSSLTQRLAHHVAALALGRPRAILTVALALVVGGGLLGSRLSLETDLAELLPPTAESVIQLKLLNQRVGGTGNVAVALSGEPDSLRTFVPQLVQILRTRLGRELIAIKYQRKEVEDYFQRFSAYYVPLPELTRWSERLREVLAEEKAAANPAYVSLDEPHGAARKLVSDIRKTRRSIGPHNVADEKSGLLMSEGGHLAVLFIRPAANSLNLAKSTELLERLRTIITTAAPPNVHLEGFTGSIPRAIAEVAAVRRDIVGTALLVVTLVGGVVILFFRSHRELLLLLVALAVGAASAFAFAYLWIGHVNAQTAFLGSIIVGTGINYGILLLARYRELRSAGVPFESALEQAIESTLRATAIAAAATAVSFGVLAAGEVESFHQFGWIGGLGIVACWLATFSVVPALLTLLDRRRVYRQHHRWQPLAALCQLLARGIEKAPRAVIAVCGLATLLSLVAVWHRRHDPLQTDMSKLGQKTSPSEGIERLDSRLRRMDTGSSTPAVIATSSRAEANAVCAVLQPLAERTNHRFMGRCYTVDAALPNELERRQTLLGELRRNLRSVPLSLLDAGDRHELEELERTLSAPPPTLADLPATLVEPFVERDGSVGKLAFVEPHSEDVAANLFAFADAISNIQLPSGKVIHSSGENVVFADVLHAVSRDAQRLTVAAAVLVLVVLLAITRNRRTFFQVSLALVVGVVWMLGLAAVLGQKLNFFNFVTLPTTFGIGIDYAINVEDRLRQRGSAGLAAALREVGPPVTLASATTIFGYVSLLSADNRALASFGSLAIVGELACLVASLVLVPALWRLRYQMQATKESKAA